MKKIIYTLLILTHSIFAETKIQNNKTLEESVLWKCKIDKGMKFTELDKLLKDKKTYKAEGHFFKCLQPTYAFNHEVIYVGPKGYDLIMGPNITLKGNTKEISQIISKKYKIKFETKNNIVFVHKVTESVAIIVDHPPNKPDQTVVIGAYFGP